MKALITVTFTIDDPNNSFWTISKLKHYYRGWLKRWLTNSGDAYEDLEVVVTKVENEHITT